jgi:hypothetical protein
VLDSRKRLYLAIEELVNRATEVLEEATPVNVANSTLTLIYTEGTLYNGYLE